MFKNISCLIFYNLEKLSLIFIVMTLRASEAAAQCL